MLIKLRGSGGAFEELIEGECGVESDINPVLMHDILKKLKFRTSDKKQKKEFNI